MKNFIQNSDGGTVLSLDCGLAIRKIGDLLYYDCGVSKHKVTLPIPRGAIIEGILYSGNKKRQEADKKMWK